VFIANLQIFHVSNLEHPSTLRRGVSQSDYGENFGRKWSESCSSFWDGKLLGFFIRSLLSDGQQRFDSYINKLIKRIRYG